METRKVNTPIHFYLKGEFIGKSTCVEKSFSADRIECARNIGIDYYDRFVLRPEDRFNDKKFEADSEKCLINGRPLNDFNNRIHIEKENAK